MITPGFKKKYFAAQAQESSDASKAGSGEEPEIDLDSTPKQMHDQYGDRHPGTPDNSATLLSSSQNLFDEFETPSAEDPSTFSAKDQFDEIEDDFGGLTGEPLAEPVLHSQEGVFPMPKRMEVDRNHTTSRYFCQLAEFV